MKKGPDGKPGTWSAATQGKSGLSRTFPQAQAMQPSGRSDGAAGTLSNLLESKIKTDIVPRLYSDFGPGVISRQKNPVSLLSPALKAVLAETENAPEPVCNWLVSEQEKSWAMQMLLDQDEGALLEFLSDLIQRGASFRDIHMGIIAELANGLGEAWDDDDLNFVDVTIASSSLMHVVRDFNRANTGMDGAQGQWRNSPLRTALVMPVPGEHHVIGSLIVESFLRQAGWSVFGGQAESMHALSVLIRKEWFTLVGISVSGITWLERCARLITNIRSQSLNPNVVIMVGGHVFKEDPSAVRLVGADVGVANAEQALIIADRVEHAVLDQADSDTKANKAIRAWMRESQNLRSRNSPDRKKRSQA